MKFCQSCGKKIVKGTNFCSWCGAGLGLTQPQQSMTPQQPMVTAQSQAVATLTPTLENTGSMEALGMTTVAVGSVKKVHHTARRLAIFAFILVFIIGAISACLTFFVSGPDDTATTFLESLNTMDVETMLSCMDPSVEKQMSAILGVGISLFGYAGGFDLDFESLLPLMPLFGSDYKEEMGIGNIIVSDVTVVLYTDKTSKEILALCEKANNGVSIGEGYDADNEIISFLFKYHLLIPGLEKLIAKTAVVKVELDRETLFLPMKNIGNGDWRLAFDLSMLAGF